MRANDKDRLAMRQALARVSRLAEEAMTANDTETARQRLGAVRTAVIDAYDLAQAIEDNTRNAALREHELRLEQRVGMPAESL